MCAVAIIGCGGSESAGKSAESAIKEFPTIENTATNNAGAFEPTLVPTIEVVATATPVATPTATSVSQESVAPSMLWQVQIPAVPRKGSANLTASKEGVFVEIISHTSGGSAGDYSIIAFDSNSGEQKWTVEDEYWIAGWGDPVPIMRPAGSGVLLVGSRAFDSRTGALKWEVPSRLGPVSFPVDEILNAQAAQDFVYLTDDQNRHLVAVDSNTGESKWAILKDENGYPVRYSRLFLIGDILYGVNTGIRSIDAIDRFTGDIQWSYKPEISGSWTNRVDFLPLIANEQGIFGIRSISPIIVYHIDPFGQLQWEQQIEIDLPYAPDAGVYMKSIEGTLVLAVAESYTFPGPLIIYGLDESTGNLLWSNVKNPLAHLASYYSKVGDSVILYGFSQDGTSLTVLNLTTNKDLGSHTLPGKIYWTAFYDGILYILVKKEESSSIIAFELP